MKKKTAIFVLLLLVFLPLSLSLGMELVWPNSPAGTALTDNSTLTDLVKYVYEWGIALGGLAAFVSLVIAGFGYLTSTGDPSKMQDAKDRATSAFLGLVLLLGSYIILNTINPELTILKPITLAPTAGMPTLCSTNTECPVPQGNATSPIRVVYKCVIPKDQTQGTCQPTTLRYSCDFAVVCKSGLDATKVITANPDKALWPLAPPEATAACCGVLTGWACPPCIRIDPKNRYTFCGIGSVASAFYDETAQKYYPCEGTGCGCSLQLMAEGFLSWGCGDMIGSVPAWDSYLADKTDKPIKCIELVKPMISF